METNRPRPKWAWFCPQCGARNVPANSTCTECRGVYLGAPMAKAAATVCDSCKERNAPAANYCQTCGKQLPGHGQRKTVVPSNEGVEVEGLIFSRDVALWEAERRRTGRYPK